MGALRALHVLDRCVAWAQFNGKAHWIRTVQRLVNAWTSRPLQRDIVAHLNVLLESDFFLESIVFLGSLCIRQFRLEASFVCAILSDPQFEYVGDGCVRAIRETGREPSSWGRGICLATNVRVVDVGLLQERNEGDRIDV